MDTLLLFARVVLVVVFALAGMSKLADQAGFRQGLTGFGLPAALRQPVAQALPWLELAVALVLLVPATARWGAVAALGLLGAFTALVAMTLAQGRRPSCNCFGQATSQPIGSGTLVRNLGLMACCLLILAVGPLPAAEDALPWWSPLSTEDDVTSVLLGALLVLTLLSGWTVFGLLRQLGRLMLRIDNLELRLEAAGIGAPTAAPSAAAMGLPVGQAAPDFVLPPLAGGAELSLQGLLAGGLPLVLVFSDPQCGPCTALLPKLVGWQNEHAQSLSLVLISRGSAEDNRAKPGMLQLRHVLLQADREVAQAYGAAVTPSAVRVEPNGSIGSSLALGELDIAALLQDTVANAADSSRRDDLTLPLPALSGERQIRPA